MKSPFHLLTHRTAFSLELEMDHQVLRSRQQPQGHVPITHRHLGCWTVTRAPQPHISRARIVIRSSTWNNAPPRVNVNLNRQCSRNTSSSSTTSYRNVLKRNESQFSIREKLRWIQLHWTRAIRPNLGGCWPPGSTALDRRAAKSRSPISRPSSCTN